jgi:GNAT superfamily N-acetyltransferase
MKVRAAYEDDLPKVMEHIYALKKGEEEMGFTGYADDKTFLKEMGKFLILIRGEDNFIILVAEDGGEIVGSLVGSTEKVEKFFKYDFIGCIRYIYVDPKAREKGVAKELVETFETIMQVNEIGAVYATIHQANTTPQFKLLHHGWFYQYVQLFREV